MVEIEYSPHKKIVVHELKKVEVADFLQWVVSQVEAQKQGGTPIVNWIDGIAWVSSEYQPTPKIIEEQLEGRIHYPLVIFTETSFQAEKRTSLNGRDYTVGLHKADDNPDFVQLVKFLKDFKP